MGRLKSLDFQQLNVVLGDPSSPPLTKVKDSLFHIAGTDVRVAITRRHHHYHHHISRQIAPPNSYEEVFVETPSIAFGIMPVSASAEFPNNVGLSRKYMHLDFIITDMTTGHSYLEGVFPELWGTRPMSPEVEAMLTPPSERK